MAARAGGGLSVLPPILTLKAHLCLCVSLLPKAAPSIPVPSPGRRQR